MRATKEEARDDALCDRKCGKCERIMEGCNAGRWSVSAYAKDLLESCEIIDKQKALIKEMRRTIYTLYMECEMYEVEINLCKDILEKTKEYI